MSDEAPQLLPFMGETNTPRWESVLVWLSQDMVFLGAATARKRYGLEWAQLYEAADALRVERNLPLYLIVHFPVEGGRVKQDFLFDRTALEWWLSTTVPA